ESPAGARGGHLRRPLWGLDPGRVGGLAEQTAHGALSRAPRFADAWRRWPGVAFPGRAHHRGRSRRDTRPERPGMREAPRSPGPLIRRPRRVAWERVGRVGARP